MSTALMKEVCSIRTRVELRRDERELALFNMAIDCRLCGCDLVRLKAGDLAAGAEVKSRAIIVQKKTGTPVHFIPFCRAPMCARPGRPITWR